MLKNINIKEFKDNLTQEVKINNPNQKKEVLEWIIKNNNGWILAYDNYEELISEYGPPEDNEWSDEIVKNFTLYFNNFKKDEAWYVSNSDEDEIFQTTLPYSYKYFISAPSNDGVIAIILHNIPNLKV